MLAIDHAAGMAGTSDARVEITRDIAKNVSRMRPKIQSVTLQVRPPSIVPYHTAPAS